MKRFDIKKMICVLLAGLMLACCACTSAPSGEPGAENTVKPAEDPTDAPKPVNSSDRVVRLTAKNTGESRTGKKPDSAFSDAELSFALELFKNGFDKEKNSLISPLSVLLALAMTANGADGETLEEMEAALGGLGIDELNEYLYAYMHSIRNTESVKLDIANSVWYKAFEHEFDPAADGKPLFVPDEAFLEACESIFGAELYSAPFDASTLEAVNNWVKEHTDGMIEKILDDIDPMSVMYLVNTLFFDAKWDTPYYENNVSEGEFRALSGERQPVEMMHSTEGTYLAGKNSVGFAKYYERSGYAFVALLPDEGLSLDEFIAGLTAEELRTMLEEPNEQGVVLASMPKFSFDYSVDLPDALRAMGMNAAFDAGAADFTRMGETAEGYPLYIGNVIHKTRIEVAEQGTRAGAATLVEMNCGSAFNPEVHEVVLDRPFVFMIMDMNAMLPLFIGTLTSVN